MGEVEKDPSTETSVSVELGVSWVQSSRNFYGDSSIKA